MTTDQNSSRFRTPAGGPLLREAPVGTKLLLKDKSVVEIIGNPGNGGWVQARYLESATGSPAAGDEAWVYYMDVQDFAQEMGSDLGRTRRAGQGGIRTLGLTAGAVSPGALERLILKDEVEQFLYHEAALLDERRYEEWIELMAEDIHYFMPIRRNVKFGEWDRENSDPASEISWFDEGKDALEGRVRQLETGVHWAEEPVSRIRHIISNVRVLGVDGDEIQTSDTFFVWHNRLLDEVNLFVGRRDNVLRRDPETGFKLAKRTILLDQSVLLAKVVTFFF